MSDALYLKAMLMTSPLAVTLGMSLTIPFALLGDVLRGTELGGWPIYVGGIFVLGAFLVNGWSDLVEVAEEIEEQEQESDTADPTMDSSSLLLRSERARLIAGEGASDGTH